jgi:hypothetical protein
VKIVIQSKYYYHYRSSAELQLNINSERWMKSIEIIGIHFLEKDFQIRHLEIVENIFVQEVSITLRDLNSSNSCISNDQILKASQIVE